APVEDMDARKLGMPALQLERIAEIGKARLLGKFLDLRRRDVRAPGVDGIAERRDLGTIGEIDVEAGAHDDGVEAMLAFGREHLRSGDDIAPALAEAHRETRMALAAQDALIGRRHLLAEDVRIEAPAPRV